jgi:hypothetical protein
LGTRPWRPPRSTTHQRLGGPEQSPGGSQLDRARRAH